MSAPSPDLTLQDVLDLQVQWLESVGRSDALNLCLPAARESYGWVLGILKNHIITSTDMIVINDNQRGDYFATSDSNLRGLAGSVETSIQRQSSGTHFLK